MRLWGPRQGGEASSTLAVTSSTVRLYSDAADTQEIGQQSTGPLGTSATDVAFPDLRARVVAVEVGGASGTFYGMRVASLAEVEVIARGEAP